MKLSCVAQQYAWGKRGSESAVANLKKMVGCDICDSERYAELWMGTHCNGPSKIVNEANEEVLLSDYLNMHPTSVGVVPPSYVNDNLPFLFKVLSVDKALSIQAHPNKVLAKELHASRPDVYKDPNHKPEMAVALTNFEALCGFRLLSEIQHYAACYPEFQTVIGSNAMSLLNAVSDASEANTREETIRSVFNAYMSCNEDTMKKAIGTLIQRIQTQSSTIAAEKGGVEKEDAVTLPSITPLILRLNQQYPNDSGIFAPILLNYLSLAPYESFFMGAGVPHAYISGDCIECMALSDNVMRVGLTPKYKDVDTLCQMLEYKCAKPTSFLTPIPVGDGVTSIYRPPITICEEFEVEMLHFRNIHVDKAHSMRELPCASIVLVYTGACQCNDSETVWACGDVYFIPAGVSYQLTLNTPSDCVMFRAHINCEK